MGRSFPFLQHPRSGCGRENTCKGAGTPAASLMLVPAILLKGRQCLEEKVRASVRQALPFRRTPSNATA
jgi:hypothetical protein